MKSTLKSLTASLAMLVMVVSLLAACGGNSSTNADETNKPATETANQATVNPATEKPATETPVEVKTLTFSINASTLRPGYQALIDYINANSEKFGAKLEVDKFPDGAPGEQVVQARFASGEVPDIQWYYGATQTTQKIAADKFADLGGSPWTSDYDAETLKSKGFTIDGKLIMAPIGETNLFGMVYNKKVFSDAGIQDVPKTWAEFLADCEAIKAKSVTPVYYSGKDSWSLQIIPKFGSTLESQNLPVTELIDNVNTNKTHFSDLKLEADSLAKYKELIDKGYVQKTWLSDTYQNAQTALLDGKVGMYPMGSWVQAELLKANPEKYKDLGYFAIPLTGDGTFYIGEPAGLYAPSGGKNVELSKKIISFMASKEGQEIYFKAQPGVPFMKGVNVELTDMLKDAGDMVNSGKGKISYSDYLKYDQGDYVGMLQQLGIGQLTIEKMNSQRDAAMKKAATAKGDTNWK
jgi:raffinose/stachyose/melibiose transport system substrate-binding protein